MLPLYRPEDILQEMTSVKIEINPQFQKALDLLEKTQKHVFLTGEAGTGKSTLLSHFRSKTNKALGVVAPTGVAAVNIQGETIHSFFGFKPGVTPFEAKNLAHRTKKKEMFETLEILIVDEISMVRADLLDTIDLFLRAVRKDNTPFGGIQVIMIGDLFQLPPVITKEENEALSMAYQSPYFFSSVVFTDILENYPDSFAFVELTKIYRQQDQGFISFLNKIRNKQATPIDLNALNQENVKKHDDPDQIILTATNYQADQINQERLNNLKEKETKYKATVGGDFSSSQFPTSEVLTLKSGARVMLLNNEPNGRWINGTLGTVTKTKSASVTVQLDEGGNVVIEPFSWDQQRTIYDEQNKSLKRETVGSFKQLPLRLAWAVTIHKAQGKTFDKVHLDLGRGAFAHGQTYVAISRCRTLQ